VSVLRWSAVGLVLSGLLAAVACTSSDIAPPRVVERRLDLSVEAVLPDTPVRQLAPIPVRLVWSTGPGFESWRDALRVRLSFTDRRGTPHFQLDHELDPPMREWLPGQEVEMLLLAFAPSTVPIGIYSARVELYSPAASQVHLVLAEEPRVVGTVEIQPADPMLSPVYLRGWGSLEVDIGRSWSTWRWIHRQADWSLEPEAHADSVVIWARSPSADPGSPQTLSLWAGDNLISTRRLIDPLDFVWSVPIGSWPERQLFRLKIESLAAAKASDDETYIALRVFNLSTDSERARQPGG